MPCRSVRGPSTAIWPQGRTRELLTDSARRASWRLVTRVLGLGLVPYRAQIAALAAQHRLPSICGGRRYAEAGCLMSYGPSQWGRGPQIATYVDKILKGAKPTDLPVEQPTTFEFVINLKTAQALGLTISPSVLFQATDVIR
jgi:ABC transporter substrate binding protein